MMRLLDRLNLRPQERRLVIFVAVVVFVALNWFFVRPFFGELGRTQQHIVDAERNSQRFSDEIGRKNLYEAQIRQLSQQGGQVPTEEQATSLSREVNTHAGVAGVNVQSLIVAPRSHDGRTNSFFEEQAVNLTFGGTGEEELIGFLYALASQNSLIRVKSMQLRPDPGRIKLGGTLTLVESFQKKSAAKSAPSATVAAVAAAAAKVAVPSVKTSAPAVKPTSPLAKVTNAPSKMTNSSPKTALSSTRTNSLPAKTVPAPVGSNGQSRTNSEKKPAPAPPGPANKP